jgi:hypothetical protein
MFEVGDHFTLVAAEGQAASAGEVGAAYTVSRKRGSSARYWLDRDDGGQGIPSVPEAELSDPAIWSHV